MKRLVLALTCVSSAWAGTVTLTMDEVSYQLINGLDVTKGGITFGFTDTSGAHYDAPNGGLLTYVQDPSIEGQTADELITVTFSVPIYSLSFGMADSIQGTTGFVLASVNFYNGANLVGNETFDATLADPWAEGKLVYPGTFGPVTSIQITPNSGEATSFGFDNLYVNTAPTPEPSTLFSSFGGATVLICLALWKLRSIRSGFGKA
jgi:hypothetical protein